MSDSVRSLLEEVVGEWAPTDEELDRTVGRARRRQRRQRVVAGVTAFVVAAAGIGAAVWAFTRREPARPAGLHANGAIVLVRMKLGMGLDGDLYRVNPDGSGLRRLT